MYLFSLYVNTVPPRKLLVKLVFNKLLLSKQNLLIDVVLEVRHKFLVSLYTVLPVLEYLLFFSIVLLSDTQKLTAEITELFER